MHTHRNTLRYRLDRICEIAQLNMKDEQLKKQMILSIYCFDLFPRIQGMAHLSPRGITAKHGLANPPQKRAATPFGPAAIKDRHGYHPNLYGVELIR